jgi:hypothetical protein
MSKRRTSKYLATLTCTTMATEAPGASFSAMWECGQAQAWPHPEVRTSGAIASFRESLCRRSFVEP